MKTTLDSSPARHGRTRGLRILLAGASLCLVACLPTGDPNDTTPPGFLQMTVTVERVTDGFREPPVDATSGLTLDNVQRNRRIILQATVADDQSGIGQVKLEGDTLWDCITPGDDLAENKHGTLGGPPDEERTSGTAPPGRPALRNVTFTLDPFSGNSQRLVCPPSDLATELLMEVTLVASNGNGLQVRSAEVSIEYQSRPPG